jgi:hypothetical protein
LKRARSTPALLAAALLTGLSIAAAGCGSPPNDLFVVTRTGSIPGAALTLLVSDDGSARCNGRPARISDQELLDARQLQRDLEQPASRATALAPGPQPVLTYSVRTPGGTLRFADDSAGKPPAFFRLAAFVREVAKRRCGLAR